MNITEVRIKLMENSDDRLRAFCSVTFDNSFVIRDLKIIDGNDGPFVAMPSRKLSAHCVKCNSKNHMRARFCNNCGARQNRSQPATDHQGRAKLYADIAHPINPECREEIQNCVLDEFEKEKERSRQPGYISNYDDIYESSHSRKSSSAKRSGATESAQRTDEGESPGKGMHRRSHDSQSSSKSQGDGELKEGTDFGNGIF